MNASKDTARRISELRAAGWAPYGHSRLIWQAPNGQCFVGPKAAWNRMKAKQELDSALETASRIIK